MMSLSFAFWMLVILFAVIGAMRGWAKEILVTFSLILALFLLTVLSRYVPPLAAFLQGGKSSLAFWIQTTLVIIMVFFGYQTPNLPRVAGARFARERLSDVLLGFVMGAINGFLIIGTLWFFLDQANYPFKNFITPPTPDNPLSQGALKIIPYLPPNWLGIPTIYFAVAIAFIFVIVVFI